MDRCAIFVDLGYVLAAAGELVLGTSLRPQMDCDYESLAGSLATHLTDHCGLPLLRSYWYDAASGGIPTEHHRQLAVLGSVKVRLGRMVQGRQKGVDSLMVRDLMTLAQARGMVTAFLVTGDDDIREGMTQAQDLGVRAVLVGVPGNNQAHTLVWESDEHLVLPAEFWSPHLSRVAPVTRGEEIVGEAPSTEQFAMQVGVDFGTAWLARATPEQLRSLHGLRPWELPAEIDSELIRAAVRALGELRERPELRRSARAGFWAALAQRNEQAAEEQEVSASEPAEDGEPVGGG
ncbi:MAG TPA: NYN domain-containing protein [Candidatus Dormibacteraeota bacterium]|nr:NYN domain-containing protein [Candidatus Dormibacteraeota bacterium]